MKNLAQYRERCFDFFDLLRIFLMLLRRLTLLVRSLVPTWTINDSGFPSRTSSISTMSPLVAPAIFKTSTFFDLDNYLPLILFNIESPIITTFFDFLLHISTVSSLTLSLFLIWGSLLWSVLREFWFTEVFLDLVRSCVVK